MAVGLSCLHSRCNTVANMMSYIASVLIMCILMCTVKNSIYSSYYNNKLFMLNLILSTYAAKLQVT